MEKKHKLKREELVIELARPRDSHAEWVTGDLNRRKEFARAFGWNKPMRVYSNETSLETSLYEPTWTEIFIELGKLLAARDFNDFAGNISELEVKLDSHVASCGTPTSPLQDSEQKWIWKK